MVVGKRPRAARLPPTCAWSVPMTAEEQPQAPLYEQFDHDADIGLLVRGGTLEELFENAARGMIDVLLEPGRVRPRRTLDVSATGDDPEMLLVAWLGEILYCFEVDHFAPTEVHVDALEEGRISGRLVGDEFDEARHRVLNPIKAVTYHNLRIEQVEGGYLVAIVFDV